MPRSATGLGAKTCPGAVAAPATGASAKAPAVSSTPTTAREANRSTMFFLPKTLAGPARSLSGARGVPNRLRRSSRERTRTNQEVSGMTAEPIEARPAWLAPDLFPFRSRASVLAPGRRPDRPAAHREPERLRRADPPRPGQARDDGAGRDGG